MRASRLLNVAMGVGLVVGLVASAEAALVDMVTVGNAGNAADTRYAPGYGSVGYQYQIGKYEVTAGQYRDFLNAVDPSGTNPNGVYNPLMDSDASGSQITWNSSTSVYDFSGCPSGSEADWIDRPVNYVSWYDAARFANWLTTGNTESGVYTFTGGMLTTILDHQAAAATAYWIPTEDEWYKAAYYDPNKGGSGVEGYWDYPMKSDTSTVPSLSNDVVDIDPGNNANFFQNGGYTIGSPYYRTKFGEFENSESAYGTFDQGGNVWEWNEAIISTSYRALRGGSFNGSADSLAASSRYVTGPTTENFNMGFRVAGSPLGAESAVPEPGSLAIWLLGGVAVWIGRYRRKR